MAIDQGHPEIPEGSVVARYTTKKWDGPTRLIPSVVVAVTVAGNRLVVNNPKRIELILQNVDVGNIYVDAGQQATANGIFLPPAGGLIDVLAEEDGEMVCYDWWGIAPVGPYNVAIWEVVRI